MSKECDEWMRNSMKNGVFWVVTPCGSCKNQKTPFFIVTAVKTSNLTEKFHVYCTTYFLLSFISCAHLVDCICGLVVRVPGYRSRRTGFDSWEALDLEKDPLSDVRITDVLFERKVAAPVYKTEINGRRVPLYWPSEAHLPQQFSLPSPTSVGHSVSIVCLRT
jgi:hypothetical protein